MENGGQVVDVATGQLFPVFRGLAIARIPGKQMAGIVGVAAPTYSKWRNGKLKIPAPTLVFLTLMLANRIEELQDQCRREGPKGLRLKATLKSIIQYLRRQETINGTLSPGAVTKGTRLFRQWWRDTGDKMVCGTDPERLGGGHE